jgi:hypothetical protein
VIKVFILYSLGRPRPESRAAIERFRVSLESAFRAELHKKVELHKRADPNKSGNIDKEDRQRRLPYVDRLKAVAA